MSVKTRIENFAELGSQLKKFIEDRDENNILSEAFSRACLENPWFTKENTLLMLNSLTQNLEKQNLELWLTKYSDLFTNKKSSKVGVVMAGNIPAVGFHDFLCVLMSGNKFIGKLSSDDKYLIPAFAKMLVNINPKYENYISFTENKLQGFDAVIATGSNNSSRYFDYYFGKYPNIIRRSRNSIAFLNGKESDNELALLGQDIYTYYGLGCRNVSKLFVNIDFSFEKLFEALKSYQSVTDNNKYLNNYSYYKTIYSMNPKPFMDNGFSLFIEDESLWAPVSVINFSFYHSAKEVSDFANNNRDKLQCVIGSLPEVDFAIPFGKSQNPELWDYADGVDTMEFLLSL
jgi:hypothetical protein